MPTKTITYDRETEDFLLELDGEFIGYARSRGEGERVLDDLMYERARRANDLTPVNTQVATPAPVQPEPATSTAPVRIAPPAIIADASAAVYALAAILPEAKRESYNRAIHKAVGQLMDGIIPAQDGHALVFPSRTRKGVSHWVRNGVCSCEAATVCWHIAAAKLVEMIEDALVDAQADYTWVA